MAYITREDGERFVIPSYRDVLTSKQKSTLKKEILLLSQNYGEFITLSRKAPTQYEVAFSPEAGYLLGESIWQYFNRPQDLIYCEAIPNTMEAILVIVKSGSVYLDGSFPIESIPEELIIFLTQQNNFEIYIYGNVPISETPEEGKFSFEASSVKSFTTLPEPVFPRLPLYKTYQLQHVEAVLRAQGIGVFPLRNALILAGLLGLGWLIWSYLKSETAQIPQVVSTTSPYDTYYAELVSPDPADLITAFIETFNLFSNIPGWRPAVVAYQDLTVSALMQSNGISGTEDLLAWAKENSALFNVRTDGIYIQKQITVPPRLRTNSIYNINDVLATLIDNLATVYPGNHLKIAERMKKEVYSTLQINIDISDVPPVQLLLIGDTLKGMPLVLKTINLRQDQGVFAGTMTLEVLGN